jgi:hypothetical protein
VYGFQAVVAADDDHLRNGAGLTYGNGFACLDFATVNGYKWFALRAGPATRW